MATMLYMSPNQDFSPPKYDKQAVSVADEVVLTMGIPQKIVEMARAFQLQTHGVDFQNAMQLYTFADELVNDPQKQHEIGKKISESERALKEKAEEENEKKKKNDHERLARAKEVPEEDGAVVKSKPAARGDAAGMQQTSLAVDHQADDAQHQQQPATKKKEENEKEVKVKAPLKEKVRRLAKENHRLMQRKMCRKCKEVDLANSGVTFLPCGHFITCETCSESYEDCPACGKRIIGTVRTYLS